MGSAVLEIRDLAKSYGRTVALDGLTLSLEPGEIFGFLGPNGAGKTTTIRLLLDLIRPTRGEIRIFGLPPRDPASRARVGYLPDLLGLDDRLTGRETLAFFDALRPKGSPPARPERVAEICSRLGLPTRDLDRVVRSDSRGTKQKVGLAAAFQGDPDLLILDEPTAGLDPLVREAVFDLMREAARAGRTIFHSSHVLSEVDRTCTRVGILREGRLVALDTIEAMRRSSVRRMVVRFEDGKAPGAISLPGVEVVEREGSRLVLNISGDLHPLLGFLAAHSVTDVVFPERDLDEAFAQHYRGPEARP
ncbi:MAG: ABC transporter ATP-binding protein [Acidobacteria bacterium]|nr:ABC transporter ATP-binding protein [Acidobacteriota bacterium]